MLHNKKGDGKNIGNTVAIEGQSIDSNIFFLYHSSSPGNIMDSHADGQEGFL